VRNSSDGRRETVGEGLLSTPIHTHPFHAFRFTKACGGHVGLHLVRGLGFDGFLFHVDALRDFGSANQANHGFANERVMTTNQTMNGKHG